MLPLLTYPLALIGLASLPALAAIYLLRNRFRKKTVSSLMLWHLQERSKEGGVKVQKVQLPLIFFLELLILALLVTAATGPRWQMGVDLRPLVVVLDNSASMLAEADGKTSRQRALEALESLLEENRFLNIRLVLAGAKPHLPGGPIRTTDEIEEQLAHWTCDSSSTDLANAVAFGREISRDDALLLVLSDEEPVAGMSDAPRLQWWAFGKRSANLAFVNAARSLSDGSDRCLLEIANFSADRRKTNLRVMAGEKLIRKTSVELETNSTKRIVLNLPANTPAIRANLDHDALAADNELQLLSPLRKRVRVSIAVEDENLSTTLSRAIESTGLRSSISTAPHLIFHDDPGAPAGTNTWSVRVVTSDEPRSLSGPFVVDTSHPVANGLALNGTVWAASGMTNESGYLPLITSGQESLLSVYRDIIGRERLILNLTPRLSTIQQTPNWPILFWNILAWRRAEMPGLEEVNFRPGTEVRIRTQGDFLEVTHPDGDVEALTVREGEIIASATTPGLYGVKAAEGEWEYSVNFLAADESDLQGTRSGHWGEWQTEEETRKQYSSVLWLFLLLALLGIVGHHFLITHGKSRL